jgi:phosphopantothenoylcysteine decarboxylase/phosphopantothenate--cysteine ligase
VLNSLKNSGAGFKCATNQVTIFAKNGAIFEGKCKAKTKVAEDILTFINEQFKI